MGISELPRKIIVEKGAIDKISEAVAGLGTKPLVLADTITQDIGGKKIAEALKCDLVLVKDSTMEEVKRLGASDADFIISFGGGKTIDVGKMIAHNKKIPFVSFPTACANDGMASQNTSLMVNGKYTSIQATSPYVVIADLDILIKSPYRTMASGVADVISKYTSTFDWKIAKEKGEEYSDIIANMSLMCADLVSSSIDEIKNRTDKGMRNLVWALIFSSNAMTLHGSSRPGSGAEHMFSHSLDMIGKFGLHGEQVGIGSIFFSYLQGQDWKKIGGLLEKVGAPTTAKQIGVSDEVFVEAMLKAKDVRKRYTIMDKKPLTRELVLKVGKETGIV